MSHYQENFKQLSELMIERNNTTYSFLRQLITVASAIFAVLVALQKKNDLSNNLNSLYLASLLLLSLGILSLAIALYGEVALAKKTAKLYEEKLREAIHDGGKVGLFAVKQPKIFPFCEVFAYIFLILALIVLTFYALFS